MAESSEMHPPTETAYEQIGLNGQRLALNWVLISHSATHKSPYYSQYLSPLINKESPHPLPGVQSINNLSPSVVLACARINSSLYFICVSNLTASFASFWHDTRLFATTRVLSLSRLMMTSTCCIQIICPLRYVSIIRLRGIPLNRPKSAHFGQIYIKVIWWSQC